MPVARTDTLLFSKDVGQRVIIEEAIARHDRSLHLETDVGNAEDKATWPAWQLVMAGLDSGVDNARRVLTRARQRGLPTLAVSSSPALVAHFQEGDLAQSTVHTRDLDRVLTELPRKGAGHRAPRRVVAIGAHPDDVELGCGGVLARHAMAGDEVTLVCLTDGGKGGSSSRRIDEAQRAAWYLGAHLHMLDARDGQLAQDRHMYSRLQDLVCGIQPDVAYIHSLNDMHPDHVAAHQLSLVATRYVPTVFAYAAPSMSTAFSPSHFVVLGESAEDKLRLVGMHVSQRDKAYMSDHQVRATLLRWGAQVRFEEAEAFEVVRQVVQTV